MLINSRYKAKDIDQKFKEFVNSQSYGLEKLVPQVQQIRWNIEQNGKKYKISCKVSSPLMTLFAKKTAFSIWEAFSQTMDSIESQARKMQRSSHKEEFIFKKTA